DLLLGAAFLLAGRQIFDAAEVPHPNHWGYVQFATLLLITFGIMFFAVAYDPVGNRNLMLYGMMLKASYAGLCAYYWITTDCPTMFKPFAIIDAVMLVLFLVAYLQRPGPRESQARTVA